MKRAYLTIKIIILMLFLGMTTTLLAQNDDFAAWTKFKTEYKIDSRFSVSGDFEFRMEDHLRAVDRLGLVVGGHYKVNPFLKLHLGYETHYRNQGESEWKFRHRYHVGATASFQYNWLKVVLRERFQQTFDRGDLQTRLRSRLKLSYAPTKGIVSPYFSVEVYQSLDDAPFWRAARVRYRPGIEIALTQSWGVDTFYCYQYALGKGIHVAGLEIAYSF